MATLMEEVETLIAASPHAMVDSALRANSLAVFDHYLRMVEDHLEDLHEVETTVGGEVRSLRRKKVNLDQKAAELDRNINVFLCEGKGDLALSAQARLNSLSRLLEDHSGLLQRQEAEFHSLKDARLKLQAKRTTVEREREEVQVLLELAHSRSTDAQAFRSLDELTGEDDEEIAKLARSIRTRLDKASARSGLGPGSTPVHIDQVLETRALEGQLAERKARLGLS